MTRLEAAHAEYVAALKVELAVIQGELARVERPETPAEKREQTKRENEKLGFIGKGKRPLTLGIVEKPKKKTKAPTKKASAPAKRRGRTAGLGTLRTADPASAKKFKPCTGCGRTDVPGKAGPGPRKDFHYAPKCGLPCAGAYLERLTAEDKANGVHKAGACPKCDRVVYK